MADDLVFDPTRYLRAPQLDVPSAVSVGVAVVAAVPAGASPAMLKRAGRVRDRTVDLQAAWAARDGLSGPGRADPRPVDVRVDRAWTALHYRLLGAAMLPAEGETAGLAKRALELDNLLFSAGLGFLQLPFEKEWAESEKRLQQLAPPALEQALSEVAGPQYLPAIKAAHALYGQVLGLTQPSPPPPETVKLRERLRELVQSIRDYTLFVAGNVESTDPASVAQARAALRPLDLHRAAAERRAAGASGGSGEPAPDASLPEGTPTTVVPDLRPA